MRLRFIAAFLAAFALTAAALGGAASVLVGSGLGIGRPREALRTSAFEMQLAPGWTCSLDGTEHVCQPTGADRRAAIAVIATKPRASALDSNDIYERTLASPDPGGGAAAGDGAARRGTVHYVRRKRITGHEWVESRHSGSEIEGFDTYYLATTTSFLGVLVTLSVRRDVAERMIGEVGGMIETLVVYQR